MTRRLATLTLALVGFIPAVALADNTTSADAHSMVIGGTPAEAAVNATGPVDRWYVTRVFNGRSYCAETQGGVHFDVSPTAGVTDTVLTVFQADATTVIVTNDDTTTLEPSGNALSRACFRSTLPDGSVIFIKVSSLVGQFAVRTRIVETTMYSNWFFQAGDYNSFVLLRNTTANLIVYNVTFRDGAGTVVATSAGTLAAQASAPLSSRVIFGCVSSTCGTSSGSVQVAHNGPEGGIFGTTTVLSGTTGLSFDTFFGERPIW